MRRIFLGWVSFLGTASLCSDVLSPAHQKNTHHFIEEILSYHVEHKEFSPLLARRSIKIFFQQFDPHRMYLLEKEVDFFLRSSEEELYRAVIDHQTSRYVLYEQMSSCIRNAIVRARDYRAEVALEVMQEVGAKSEPLQAIFSKDTTELRKHVRYVLSSAIEMERKAEGLETLSYEDKKQILALFEARIRKTEDRYLADDGGYYLSTHIMKAFAKSLDAHSSFFSLEEAASLRTSLEKQFEGVGIVFREGIRGIMIKGLVKGGPAERTQKLQIGDRLIAINGRSVEGVAYGEAMEWLKQDYRGKVHLTIQRGIAEKVSVEVEKERITLDDERLQYSAYTVSDGIIGVLHLPAFYEGNGGVSAEEDIKRALKELKAKGPLQGLVLDVRDNTGGFLSQAVKVAGLFITSGVVVISKYAEGQIQYLREVDGKMFYKGPLVMLTSKLSASATEIVAQALQDYGIALVVGDHRTYGKGTIQYQTVTDDRAKSFFKVTIGKYYTVSGRSTQIEGVKADIVVPTKYAPFNIGEKYLLYPLKNDQVPSAFFDPCLDVDPKQMAWFEKNYFPHLQKRISSWREMLPMLKKNSENRLTNDADFIAFFDLIKNRPHMVDLEEATLDDLQLQEAIHIVQDMISLKALQAKESYLQK